MIKKSGLLLGILVALMFVSTFQVQAQDPVRKLGRGVCNTAFGVFEIPLKMWDVNKSDGGVACITDGPFLGIGHFLLRECVGVLEIVTFPMPLPGMTDSPNKAGWGYAPIIEPEFIFDYDHNPYNIIYQDFPVD